MQAFTFSTSHQIVCEWGASARLGEFCSARKFQKVLVVTDPSIKQLKLHQPCMKSLLNAEIEPFLFSEVQADPTEAIVSKAVLSAKEAEVDAIIGFGGGSSMDVAKLVALLAHPKCVQSLKDVYGINNTKGHRLPLIQVPTTAGTGSEVTQVSIVTTGETTKMGAVSPLFLPDLAILDAKLTLGLPPQITAATGIDAMVHAIEAYTSKIKKNPISDMMAKEALSLLANNIRTAVHNGHNQSARESMLLGAMLAGQAFANAPVAAVHALAYPLGGHFHIPHGLSNSLVLTQVMRFNLEKASHLYAELAPIMFPNFKFSGTVLDISTQLIELIEELINELGLPNKLRDLDIPHSYLKTLANDAMLQTRLLVNNPREVSYESALAIYEAAY